MKILIFLIVMGVMWFLPYTFFITLVQGLIIEIVKSFFLDFDFEKFVRKMQSLLQKLIHRLESVYAFLNSWSADDDNDYQARLGRLSSNSELEQTASEKPKNKTRG